MVVTNTVLNQIKADINTELAKNSHMAVGTGTTTPTASDTTLVTEVLRKARQQYLENDTTATSIVSMRINTSEANGSTLTEVGGFDAASSGTMRFRLLLTSTAKTSSVEMWIDVTTVGTVSQS